MSDETSKYVYANIRIPIKIKSDYSFELLNNCMEIDFEQCDTVPESVDCDHQSLLTKLFSTSNVEFKTENSNPNSNGNPNVDEKIADHLDNSNNTIIQEMMKVFASDYEKKTPKRRENSTFKKRRIGHQFTRKHYG